jgi:UDP-2,3-diacylglucosamine pyrophosphatase LpxH
VNATVVGDLHIGSRYFSPEVFRRFLESLPERNLLILNGDTLHKEPALMEPAHLQAIDAIAGLSLSRRVVWIVGNHDARYRPPQPEKIDFCACYDDNGTLLVTHGQEFVPCRAALDLAGAVLQRIRVKGDCLMSTRSARKLPRLFSFFVKRSAAKAAAFARRKGYSTIVCGHLHEHADLTFNGVRYINTGSWIDGPVFRLDITDDHLRLQRVREEAGDPP